MHLYYGVSNTQYRLSMERKASTSSKWSLRRAVTVQNIKVKVKTSQRKVRSSPFPGEIMFQVCSKGVTAPYCAKQIVSRYTRSRLSQLASPHVNNESK